MVWNNLKNEIKAKIMELLVRSNVTNKLTRYL